MPLVDPDDGLELRPEFVESLETYLASEQRGDDSDDVFRKLGLEKFTMPISLRSITQANWEAVYDLTATLSAEQQSYVMPNGLSMLEAFYEPEVFFPRAIYAEENPVGFLMTGEDAANQRHWLVRFMIGGEHQGKGYGRAAMRILIDEYQTLPKAAELYVSVEQNNHVARAFYASLGFLDTERIIDADCIYRLPLRQPTEITP